DPDFGVHTRDFGVVVENHIARLGPAKLDRSAGQVDARLAAAGSVDFKRCHQRSPAAKRQRRRVLFRMSSAHTICLRGLPRPAKNDDTHYSLRVARRVVATTAGVEVWKNGFDGCRSWAAQPPWQSFLR